MNTPHILFITTDEQHLCTLSVADSLYQLAYGLWLVAHGGKV